MSYLGTNQCDSRGIEGNCFNYFRFSKTADNNIVLKKHNAFVLTNADPPIRSPKQLLGKSRKDTPVRGKDERYFQVKLPTLLQWILFKET